jgi:hypothetical protein
MTSSCIALKASSRTPLSTIRILPPGGVGKGGSFPQDQRSRHAKDQLHPLAIERLIGDEPTTVAKPMAHAKGGALLVRIG